MYVRPLFAMLILLALASQGLAQAVRSAPYNSQLRTAPEVGNVQGIQRYGRTLRTDPDQGEGFSYHVYPVANNAPAAVAAKEPLPAQFDFELKKLEQKMNLDLDLLKQEKDPKKLDAKFQQTLSDYRLKVQELTQQANAARFAAIAAQQQAAAPANPNPPLFDSTLGMRRPSISSLPLGLSRPLGDTTAPGGAGGSEGGAELAVVHQPLIQIKMRVVEVDRSNSLLVSSVLDFVGAPGNPNTLIKGNNINNDMRNGRASTRMPNIANLISIGAGGTLTGSGALVNLTTGNMNLIASMLQQEFRADTITAPQVVTLNDQNVEFVAGQRVPFALGQNVINGNNNNIQQFFYKHVGTYVSITPHIVNWGKGNGGGRAPLTDADIADWGTLLDDIKNHKLVVAEDTLKAIGPFLRWRDTESTTIHKGLPFPIPASVKNSVLAELRHYPRTELIKRYGAPGAEKKACETGCDWRPEDCTIDLEVVLRLSDGGTAKIKLSPQGGAAEEQEIPIENNVRAMANIVQVKSGHGVIIGGLIAEHEVHDISKVPVLGDIPAVGALFRAKSSSRQKTEVLVFIEAQVLDSCPPAARAQSAGDFVLGKAYVAGDFLDNPLERGMYRAGFGTYLPPHSREERVFWERLGRKVRTISTTISDILE